MLLEGGIASAARRAPRQPRGQERLAPRGNRMSLLAKHRSSAAARPLIGQVFRVGILLLPFTLLSIAALRFPGANNPMLWLATAFQGIVCLLTFLSGNNNRQAVGP